MYVPGRKGVGGVDVAVQRVERFGELGEALAGLFEDADVGGGEGCHDGDY